MPTKVVPAVLPAPVTTYAWVVPGNEKWSLRTVCATIARGAGGASSRSYLLEVVASGFTLAAVGAPDAGTDPGEDIVTFADVAGQSSAAGPFGVVVAPLNLALLPAGYELRLSIVGAVAGDQITSAVTWVDYTATTPV